EGAMFAAGLLRGSVRLFDVPLSVNFSEKGDAPQKLSEAQEALWQKCRRALGDRLGALEPAPAAQAADGGRGRRD
ncbi:hypothetical protein MNEG_15898, partial [Monoraphidium neglectum]